MTTGYNQAVSTFFIVHHYSKERKEVSVLHASKNWKLEVRYDICGTYWFDVKTNEVRFTESGRKTLPWWQAEDIELVTRLWKRMVYPEKEFVQDEKGLALLAKIRQHEADSAQNPTQNAINYAANKTYK